MTNRERLTAVLSGKEPDRIPFAPFDELIPRGGFERELRNRGMGLIANAGSLWSETPNISFARRCADGERTTVYRTPVGDVSAVEKIHAGRVSNDGTVAKEFLIKSEKDYAPVIFMLDDTVFHRDDDAYFFRERALGDDGIVHTWAGEPPYMDAQYFLGLENWSYQQEDHPEAFAALLAALDRRQERRLGLLLDGPDQFVNLGNLAGNFGPEPFRQYLLPYFVKYARLFQEAGKKATIHADASNLSQFKELLRETEIGVVEAFTPPPTGDLPLAEARLLWGEDRTIWINFPESVFYSGYEGTVRYTVDLLRSDPSPNKILGFTEMGLMGAKERDERIFREGFTAVLDGIETVFPGP